MAWLMGKIAKIDYNFKNAYCISIYAMTLSIILLLIYMVINIFTNVNVKYFDIAYDLIAYVYIITAILLIKSDLIKQKIEVGKIEEEQKKVHEELEEQKRKEEEQEEKDKKEDNEEDKQKKRKLKKENEDDLQGNQA